MDRTAHFDVAVCGGGFGGISAASAAAAMTDDFTAFSVEKLQKTLSSRKEASGHVKKRSHP